MICWDILTMSEIKNAKNYEEVCELKDQIDEKINKNGRITLSEYCQILGIKDTQEMRRHTKAATVLHRIKSFNVAVETVERDGNDAIILEYNKK